MRKSGKSTGIGGFSGFESLPAHFPEKTEFFSGLRFAIFRFGEYFLHRLGALAQLARASHWQCEGQRFKSAMLHHFFCPFPDLPMTSASGVSHDLSFLVRGGSKNEAGKYGDRLPGFALPRFRGFPKSAVSTPGVSGRKSGSAGSVSGLFPGECSRRCRRRARRCSPSSCA